MNVYVHVPNHLSHTTLTHWFKVQGPYLHVSKDIWRLHLWRMDNLYPSPSSCFDTGRRGPMHVHHIWIKHVNLFEEIANDLSSPKLLVGGFNLSENYYCSQIGSFPQIGMKIKNASNHHPGWDFSWSLYFWKLPRVCVISEIFGLPPAAPKVGMSFGGVSPRDRPPK